MRRLHSALIEWLQLRARLREERQFHLDCAASDYRGLGMTPREARRLARHHFGRRDIRSAARELEADLKGLAHLIHSNRVLASPWLQPAALLSVTALIVLLNAEPREILKNVFPLAHRVDTPGAVLLTVEHPRSWFSGAIESPQFEALQSMTTLTSVERYQGSSYAWGQAVPGATLPAIVSEARLKTGNAALTAQFPQPHWELLANPAQSVWLLIAGYSLFLLLRYASQFGASRRLLWRWLLYGAAVGALHAATSLSVWAFAVQTRGHIGFTAFVLLFSAYLGIAFTQCRYWWNDLRERCPICFERMILPLTEGVPESMICAPAITESVCAHGHGVLQEGRWSRQFRHETSPLDGMVRT